ncbi:unnamed protein product [Symbiodinium natans]|uniref:C3H1-type domain-containing protein n=1 Tax=Symbiodinium natans TaxID=878477 RepID=A0A812KU75_9DINO|nr:unnamed protein product [Symbiodinium natans]
MAVSLDLRSGRTTAYEHMFPQSSDDQVAGSAPGRWRGTRSSWFANAQRSQRQEALSAANTRHLVDESQLQHYEATEDSSEDISSVQSQSQSHSSLPLIWPAPQPVVSTKVHYLWDAGEDSSSVSNSVVSGNSSRVPAFEAALPSRTGAGGEDTTAQPADAGDYTADGPQPQLTYSDFLIASRRDKDIRHQDMDYWLPRIPLNEKGHLTSVGSIAHVLPDAKCKPCIFLSTPYGCERGRECPFCHLSHKFRMCKGKRDRTKRLLEKHEQYLAQQRQDEDGGM